MTNNEILKALDKIRHNDCMDCPNYDYCSNSDCLMVEAYNLIYRQRAEIDRLNDLFNKAEIIIRPEAIEEFKDRLKTRIDKIIFKYGHYCESEEIDKLVEDIDSIAKEMTEE